MASLGLNVRRDGSDPLTAVRYLGASWIRIVATPEHDLRTYFSNCKAFKIKVLLVLARESGGDYARYRDLYGGLIDAIQVGNEADLVSSSSWTMSQLELAALGRSVRAIFPTTPLVCSGLASGQPGWLDGMDLSWCDAIAVHPYAKDSESATDLEDQPDMQPLLREYKRFGKPILVTEWGWPSDDEPRASEEITDTIDWAVGTDEIEAFFYFALNNDVIPFGLLYENGVDYKPKGKAFRKAFVIAEESQWPNVSPPTPAPSAYNPWQYFTAEQLATVTNCPLDAVTENWPRLVEQLHHCGINDRLTQIAMAATVAIETAHTFRPVREAFWMSEEWRRVNLARYYPFYGRGYIQVTWRENYAEYGPKIAKLWGAGGWESDFDLVGNPDNALNPDISAAISALYFRDHGGDGLALIPKAANLRDWREVRRLVQGADAGLDDLVRIATSLEEISEPGIEPEQSEIEALRLALRTLRDKTLQDALDEVDTLSEDINRVHAQIIEAMRICKQFVGDD